MNDEKQQKQTNQEEIFQSFQNIQSKGALKNVDKDDDRYNQMKDSYKASSWYAKTKLREEEPEMAAALDKVDESNVIVVQGGYDNCELVLRLADIPHVVISEQSAKTVSYRPDQTVFINCPGNISDKAIRKLVTFVHEGGLLITTDWALQNVLEKGFPDKVKYNQKPTGDEVVRITVKDPDNPIVKGFLEAEGDPLWWLEGSSYPIEILDKKNVKVLVYSNELKTKYGESPVIVEFEHGEGKVIHMISHFYLQRTETRDKKDKMAASTAMEGKYYEMAPQAIKEKLNATDTASFKSAQSSVDFIQKNIAAQKIKSLKKEEDNTE
ncbi:MAG: hypothetical protein KGD64_06990 [Candidatus Heimdallarchaeota archaeon]|nr:hypothetical protein [Candidatus Heimdallarchaeota archaeon]